MNMEEAIKILKAIRIYECYPKSASEETKEAIDMAIEALSVVQCKDCRSFYEELCTDTGSPVEPNDYCSYGKRRTE